jgi:C1A family cysteine protease
MKQVNLIIIFAAIFGFITAENLHDKILSPFLNGPTKELFKVYHEVYQKSYDLNTEEGLMRYRIFKENLNLIREENSKGHDYKLGITPFTDMTNEEYREKMLMQDSELAKHFEQMEDKSTYYKNPDFEYGQGQVYVDWTEKLGKVKNQGDCGSCWAFAAMSSIEANYNIKSGVLIEAAPQQLVDCSTGNSGCNGGRAAWALNYAIANGVALESDYPYVSGKTRIQNTCTYNSDKGLRIVKSRNMCLSDTCTMDLWSSMIKEGPLTVGVDARSFNFQNYKSGVIDLKDCGCANHAVVAVGLLNDEKGDYVKILNSWGSSWGSDGFISVRVDSSSKTCRITESAFLPIVGSPEPKPTPVPFRFIASFYDRCQYTGDNIKSYISLKTFKQNSNLDLSRKIQSIKTDGYYKVTLYSEINCTGKDYTFTSDESCLFTSTNTVARNAINNSMSASILSRQSEPKEGCIALFTDSCFLGERQEICGNIDDLNGIAYDKKIVSIAIGKNVTGVVVFVDPFYKGFAFGLTSSIANLNQQETVLFSNSISSIRILKN